MKDKIVCASTLYSKQIETLINDIIRLRWMTGLHFFLSLSGDN